MGGLLKRCMDSRGVRGDEKRGGGPGGSNARSVECAVDGGKVGGIAMWMGGGRC